MTSNFDLIVIGTGSAGASVAHACRREGWEVAIIDSRSYGGTCALRGCDPKKVMVAAVDLVDRTTRLLGKGIEAPAQINWADLMKFKRTFTEPVPEAHEQKMIDAGIHTFHGAARFAGEDQVEVNGQLLQGKHILIATGATPAPLSIEGEQYISTSDDFLDLDELPDKIVFIGGGYISFEFAHIAAMAGAEVHILHTSDQPLKGFDPDLVHTLVEHFGKLGIHVHLNVSLQSVKELAEEDEYRYRLHADRKSSSRAESEAPLELDCNLIVHGAGRMPNIYDLQLDQAGVAYEKKGVTVNKYLQSVSNPRVYAAGDCAASPGLPLTPLAGLEAKTVSHNLLSGNSKQTDYTEMPSVAFTMPRLASVGISEKEAAKLGDQVKINTIDVSSWFTYKRTHEQAAMIKVILDKNERTVLGAHLLSSEADELINHFAVAIRLKLTVDDLQKVTYAYPTIASDLSYMLEI